MNIITQGFQSINKTFERSLDFRPLETGFLQLANSDERRTVRNRIATIGAAATLPADRLIATLATPIITVIEHIRDIKQSKGLKKGAKFIATLVWIPFKAALKTAAFALYAFARLPHDIFKAIQGVRTESPLALKREYTGRLKEAVLQKCHGLEGADALAHALIKAGIEKPSFDSIHVVTIGKSGMADGIMEFNTKKLLTIAPENAKKTLVIFQSIDGSLEAECKGDADMAGGVWQEPIEAPGENIAHHFPPRLSGIPKGCTLYFMGQRETDNLRHGILPKNLEETLKPATS